MNNFTATLKGDSARQVWLLIIAATILLPWLVGIGTKIYLDMQGYPTYPWSYFLNPLSLLILIPISLWWGLPMIVIAFMARHAIANPGELFPREDVLLIVAFTAIGGYAGMTKVMLPVFRDYDPMYVIVPLFFYYFHWIVGGFILGLIVASSRVIWRKHSRA